MKSVCFACDEVISGPPIVVGVAPNMRTLHVACSGLYIERLETAISAAVNEIDKDCDAYNIHTKGIVEAVTTLRAAMKSPPSS